MINKRFPDKRRILIEGKNILFKDILISRKELEIKKNVMCQLGKHR